MNKEVRVLSFGWYGAGNIGDELLLETLKNWCNEMGAKLSALSINPAHTQNAHQIKAIDAYDLPAVAHAMQNNDLFILGGGGLFQTHHTFTIPALYSYTQADISAYARPVLMAKQMGLTTLLWAQGVGPLDGDDARQIVRNIFSEATHVSVRDENSISLLNRIGVDRDITVAPDPVWAYPIPTRDQQPNKETKRIALVLRPWAFVQGWEERFIKAFKENIPTEGYTLVWLPFQPIDVPNRSESDTPFIKNLMQQLGDQYTHELIECTTGYQVAQALANCDCVISMRLHAQILALKMGKPTLCIEYDPKMSSVSTDAAVPAPMRLTPDAPIENWRAAFIALAAHDQFTEVTSRVKSLSEQAMTHRNVLEQAIDSTVKRTASSNWQENNFDWLASWADGLAHQLWSQRDSTIENLNHHLEERTNIIANLNQNAADSSAQIASLNQATAESSIQITNLNKTLADRDQQLASANTDYHSINTQLIEMKNSTSWVLTRPLRFIKLLFKNPKKSTYELAKFLFWRMSPSTRQKLHTPRHKFVRWIKGLPTPISFNHDLTNSTSDLRWDDFSNQVLSRRNEYKGIFVQELVIDWNVPLYQRPQHISAAFGRLGYLVIYKTDNWAGDNVNGFREVSKNVWITNRYEVNQITNVVRSLYSTAYANTPELILENGKRGILIYEYIDHIDPQISGDPENIKRLLALKDFAFGGGADFVVASASRLEAEAIDAVGSSKVILAQNGVDTRHYRNPIHKNTPLPESLITFRKKYSITVGYFGALAPWLWYETLAELVEKRPDLGFIFIGPDYYGGADKLPKAENILYLGTVDYKILPAYAQQFDICFIPFSPGEIARTTSPLKLFEYFALEKPVVVTSEMLECIAFKEVFSGNSAQSLSKAIDESILIKDDNSFKTRLAQLADENDWDERARAMETVFNNFEHSV